VPVDKIDQSVASIEDVNVFLIIDGRIGGFGAIDYTVPSDLQKNLSVMDPQGQPMALIPEGKQSTSVKNLIATMGPVFTNMLGDVGKHMSFLVFEGRSKRTFGGGSRSVVCRCRRSARSAAKPFLAIMRFVRLMRHRSRSRRARRNDRGLPSAIDHFHCPVGITFSGDGMLRRDFLDTGEIGAGENYIEGADIFL
jgi:hypothetical protein